MSRRDWHKLCWSVHWWFGLWAGGCFALSGLTGSCLVFYQHIDEWLNPEIRRVVDRGTYRRFEDMVAAARTARPDLPQPYGLFLPQSRQGVVEARFKVPVGEAGPVMDIEVTIDPFRAEVLGRGRIWGHTVVSWIYEVHKAWLLDGVGDVFVGSVGLLLVLSIGSGLFLWWKKPGRVCPPSARTPKAHGSRLYGSLHTLTGLVGSVPLLVVAGTGLYLVFPAFVVPLVHAIFPVPSEKEWRSTVTVEASPLSVDQAVDVAVRHLPDGELKWIGLPEHRDDTYQVGLRLPGEVRRTSSDTVVWIDQYSGAVVHVQDWRRFTVGETVLAWLFPLHNGEAFGSTGRWVVFVAGLVPMALYVTACRLWWLKRAARVARCAGPPPLASP